MSFMSCVNDKKGYVGCVVSRLVSRVLVVDSSDRWSVFCLCFINEATILRTVSTSKNACACCRQTIRLNQSAREFWDVVFHVPIILSRILNLQMVQTLTFDQFSKFAIGIVPEKMDLCLTTQHPVGCELRPRWLRLLAQKAPHVWTVPENLNRHIVHILLLAAICTTLAVKELLNWCNAVSYESLVRLLIVSLPWQRKWHHRHLSPQKRILLYQSWKEVKPRLTGQSVVTMMDDTSLWGLQSQMKVSSEQRESSQAWCSIKINALRGRHCTVLFAGVGPTHSKRLQTFIAINLHLKQALSSALLI